MRKRFESQLELGATPISEITFNLKSRHELPPVLMALQYIFVHSELNESIFTLLEQQVYPNNNHTGRPGMSLWEIFVLSVVRLTLDVDYDFLLDLANNHIKVRQLLGVNTGSFAEQKEYGYQTLHDNIMKLDDELLSQINEMIVKHGHQIKKNEIGIEADEKFRLRVKTDSYVVETNIHFPTDINLMWDCARKCLDTVEKLKKIVVLKGWRESGSISIKTHKAYRKAAEIHRKKGNNYKERLRAATSRYLVICGKTLAKVKYTLNHTNSIDLNIMVLLLELQYYKTTLEKHMDLVERRIMLDQSIPHEEKVFSIFEPHTEWINKGKSHKKVELGLNLTVSTDQYNFILDYKVLENQVDKEVTIEMGNRIVSKYSTTMYIHESISFDRGYYSSMAKSTLAKKYKKVVLPKPGKKTLKESEEENEEEYKILRKRHSQVESNINALEHHGLNKCPDKGIKGFKKYVALGVISYNLHQLGKLLIQKAKSAEVPKRKAA